MFRKSIVLFIAIVISNICVAQLISRLDNSNISAAVLDEKINHLIKAANVHGIAISIFNNNKVVYKKTFGYKRADLKQPLQNSTNLYGASLSKAVFAVLVMKLVEEGTIDLDIPLESYLSKPIYEYKPLTKWHDNYSNLRNDSLYKNITARMCLSHSTGFANWRWDEKDNQLKVNFIPGSRYGYSGEGMVYLQVVLEKLTGKTLEALMNEKIFQPLGMHSSAYSWKEAFENDYAWGHRSNGDLYEKDKDNEPRAASTLETTLNDYSIFSEAVLQGKILQPSSAQKMFSPQMRLRSLQQFGPLRFRDSTLNDGIKLSSALGWLFLESPYGFGVFKEGHGDGFQHYTILFPEKGIGIVIMSNSDNGESIFKELLETAIADTFTPWYWENYIPYNYENN